MLKRDILIAINLLVFELGLFLVHEKIFIYMVLYLTTPN